MQFCRQSGCGLLRLAGQGFSFGTMGPMWGTDSEMVRVMAISVRESLRPCSAAVVVRRSAASVSTGVSMSRPPMAPASVAITSGAPGVEDRELSGVEHARGAYPSSSPLGYSMLGTSDLVK